VSTLAFIESPMKHVVNASSDASSGTSTTTTSIFDIPSKSMEELQSIVSQELPALRKNRNLRDTNMNKKSFPQGFGIGPKTAVPKTPQEKAQAKIDKAARIAQRRQNAKDLIHKHQPEPGVLQKMSPVDIQKVYGNAIKQDPELNEENNKWMRDLSSNYRGSNNPDYLVATDEYYDEWAQGYRMLGGFIDCDAEGGDSHDSGDGNNGGDGQSCSRWMMWAAYINPNYSGGGRDEYFKYNNGGSHDNYDEYGYTDDDGNGVTGLDCHSPSTEWELIGVYREEFYQFIEQISKHVWAIDDYEYVVALSGLAYMTDADCTKMGQDSNGDYLYSGIMPYTGGMYSIGLYTDATCLYPDTSGYTYDDFGQTTTLDLGSKDDGSLSDDTLNTLNGYWEATQEYTLELLNEVYSEFKYCTLCMDYPTYQDGYFIGDSGTDEDDMINQCWKFHSHDSYNCETGCIALGDAQGSILQINYAGRTFGTSWDGSGASGSTKVFDHYAKGYTSDSGSAIDRFKANAYITFNGVLFIATFLAFSVARGSRVDASEKSRSLLSREDRKKARSSSRKSKTPSSRSKSSSGRKKSSSGVSRSGSRKRSSSRK